MIKNDDTQLLRISYIDTQSECYYVRIKKSDMKTFDYVSRIKDMLYMGSEAQRQLAWKYSSDTEQCFIDIDEADEEEVEELFEDEKNEDRYLLPNILITPSDDGKSVEVSVCELENPYSHE